MEGVGGSGLRYALNSHFSIPHSGRVLDSTHTHTHTHARTHAHLGQSSFPPISQQSIHIHPPQHLHSSHTHTYTHTAKALSILPFPALPSTPLPSAPLPSAPLPSSCTSSSQASRCHIPSDTEPQCGHWLLNQQTPSLSYQHSSVWPHLPRQESCLYTTPSQLASRDRPRCSDIQPECPREEGEHCTGVSCCGIRLCAQTLDHSSGRLGSPPMDWLQHSRQWEPSG